MPILPKFTVATKLYAIFTLLAMVTVGIALLAAVNANRHAALTDEYEIAFKGAQAVERITGLLHGAEMEARGIYLAEDARTARGPITSVTRLADRLGEVLKEWQGGIGLTDIARFQPVAERIKGFEKYYRELVDRAKASGPQAARQWGDTTAHADERFALVED